MRTENILVQELLKLGVAYRAGLADLHKLASRSETLIENMRSELPEEDFACAMNCVYLFEEINALVLDENRQPTQTEQDAIKNELTLLEKVIARNCEQGELE